MPLKDGGGSSTRHTFLGRREGRIALPFPGTVVYLGHPVCGQQSPLVSHFWKTPSKRCVSQEISNHEMMMKMNHDTTLVVLGTHCYKPYKKIS